MSRRWIDCFAEFSDIGHAKKENVVEKREKEKDEKLMRGLKCLVRTSGLVIAMALVASQGRAALSGPYAITDGGSESFSVTWDGHTGSHNVGELTLTQTGFPFGSFNSVCTDIGAVIFGPPSFTYTFTGPVAFNGQHGINPTWGADNAGAPPATIDMADAAAAIQVAADVFAKHAAAVFSEPNSPQGLTDKAALQLAVWEALYDTASGGSTVYNLSGGRFSVTGADTAAITEAGNWLNLDSHTATYAGYLYIPTPQDPYFGIPAQEVFATVSQVPEPTTMIAGALLLLPFGASTLRFVRKHRVG